MIEIIILNYKVDSPPVDTSKPRTSRNQLKYLTSGHLQRLRRALTCLMKVNSLALRLSDSRNQFVIAYLNALYYLFYT